MDAKTKEAIDLLRTLIATPSPSRDESRTADLIFAYLAEHGAAPERLHNNVFARSAGFDPARPTLLLNSHHDTVRPAASYTRDPYAPTVEGDRLYGLGSNDAGASAVSLTQTFLTLRTRPLPFNLLLALSAEEECMGEHGMRALLPQLGRRRRTGAGRPRLRSPRQKRPCGPQRGRQRALYRTRRHRPPAYFPLRPPLRPAGPHRHRRDADRGRHAA